MKHPEFVEAAGIELAPLSGSRRRLSPEYRSIDASPSAEARFIAYNSRMNEHEEVCEPESASDDGVDVTLIRWLLSLTPAERLQVLQSNSRSLEKIRGAADRR